MGLEAGDNLVVVALVLLLKVGDLVLEADGFLQLLIVFLLKLVFHLLLVGFRLSEPVMHLP